MKVIVFFIFFLSSTLIAQVVPHEYLVERRSQYSTSDNSDTEYNEFEIYKINSYVPISILRFPDSWSTSEELQWLNSNKDILRFNPSRTLNSRTCNPNDPEYFRQWNLPRMGFDEVWCYDNDGISPLGDTLVIGLMDFGFDFKLDEILPNVFVNYGEIPGNGIDDDMNGYVDDYYGYAAGSPQKDDSHKVTNHGTEVASLIMAKGNNKKGISGTNQTIKVLLCSGSSDVHMVDCYTYFYRMKEAYMKSGGKKGAYVVATSISLGFDFNFPEEFPTLCPIYDWLGSMGIMNVCATVNREDHDIALLGDVPSLCPSPYLISVTNTDFSDRKVFAAGFNSIHVDIGASGEEITVIQQGGKLGTSSGCSLSAPEVAGGIMLINQFCKKYAQLLKDRPLEALLLMRDFVLNCGDKNESLESITSSGKRFNVYKSMLCIEKYCNSISDTTYVNIEPNPVVNQELKIKLEFSTFGDYHWSIYNGIGQIIRCDRGRHGPGDDLNELEIPIYYWPSGIYIFEFIMNDIKIARSFVKY